VIRTVISLDTNEKKWLDKTAKKQHISMAQLIRIAIKEYRDAHQEPSYTEIDYLLQQSKGIWPNEDGLKYQTNVREEWRGEK
jgi:hypothetical protein